MSNQPTEICKHCGLYFAKQGIRNHEKNCAGNRKSTEQAQNDAQRVWNFYIQLLYACLPYEFGILSILFSVIKIILFIAPQYYILINIMESVPMVHHILYGFARICFELYSGAVGRIKNYHLLGKGDSDSEKKYAESRDEYMKLAMQWFQEIFPAPKT